MRCSPEREQTILAGYILEQTHIFGGGDHLAISPSLSWALQHSNTWQRRERRQPGHSNQSCWLDPRRQIGWRLEVWWWAGRVVSNCTTRGRALWCLWWLWCCPAQTHAGSASWMTESSSVLSWCSATAQSWPGEVKSRKLSSTHWDWRRGYTRTATDVIASHLVSLLSPLPGLTNS